MDPSFDVPDSTDWLNTPLAALADLENALHCQICKEFYDTPMITSCQHTFCSRCIRTSLSSDGHCPACRASDQASKLRNNWAIQEVVSTFLVARPSALDIARKAKEDAEQAKRSGKRKRADLHDGVREDDEISSGRTTRSKSRKLNDVPQSSQPEVIDVGDECEDGDAEPEEKPIDDGLVECPLGCGRRMAVEAVEPHLDKCEDERQQAAKAQSRSTSNTSFNQRPPSNQNTRPQDRLAELNYSMMKELAMSKKLKELGVPTWGGKPIMVNRHKEWVNIWNANCDSNQPRPKRDLLRDLDTWERTQGGLARAHISTPANGIMRKDFDGSGWANKNRDEFSRLIADARRRKTNPASSPPSSDTLAASKLQGDDVHPLPTPDTGIERSSFSAPDPPANGTTDFSTAPMGDGAMAVSSRTPPSSSGPTHPQPANSDIHETNFAERQDDWHSSPNLPVQEVRNAQHGIT